MTRYTNVAYKRKYLEAGFDTEALSGPSPAEETTPTGANDTQTTDTPRKKRKRNAKSKSGEPDSGAQVDRTFTKDKKVDESGSHNVAVMDEDSSQTAQVKSRRKGKKVLDAEARSEWRRKKRINERYANTTCLACRDKGHMAKHCPNARPESNEDGNGNGRGQKGKNLVGSCYRCGSRSHNLSKCKKSVDPENPLPFASCFVCSGTGHLVSGCPQNQAKGIYPNGGSCKLCGETSHLAKNCSLRQDDSAKNVSTSFVGIGREAGADEDDFHTFKRRKAEVELEEKQVEKMKRLAHVKAGAHSGIVKAFGRTLVGGSAKKVVFF